VIHISPARDARVDGRRERSAAFRRRAGDLWTVPPRRQHTAPSNEEFDASLKSRDPEWGVRDMEEVQAAADRAGLSLDEAVAMPANNFTLVFRR
jgi:hypothetical protein